MGPNTPNHQQRYTEINLKFSICEDLHKWQVKINDDLFQFEGNLRLNLYLFLEHLSCQGGYFGKTRP